MCKDVQPDDITFVSLLPACSHAVLVDEGMHCYASMITCYMICAKLEHYTCMLNLLVCIGHLQESENMINRMPCKPHVVCHGCLCWALAKFMVMWRWEKALLNEFLNWRLKMLLVCASIKNLCCCWQHTSL
jgi:hypothetical protein